MIHCTVNPSLARIVGLAARWASTVAAISVVMLLGVSSPTAAAGDDEQIGVAGSDTKYPVKIENTIGEKKVALAITGAAQRKKSIVKVYTVGSYVQQGVAVKDAAELAHKDCAKQLHIVMERGVSGQTMAEAFNEGIELNYDASKFTDQKAALLAFMKGKDLKEGDHVWLTHIPGVGFECRLPGDQATVIKNVEFAVAIWEIYFGKKDIGEGIKDAMSSRLPIAGS